MGGTGRDYGTVDSYTIDLQTTFFRAFFHISFIASITHQNLIKAYQSCLMM